MNTGLYKSLNDASQFVGPIILKEIVKANANPHAVSVNPYALVGILFLGQIVGAIGSMLAYNLMLIKR